jgi:glycosyltransferase involved in cell wall biosynthesis
MRIVIVSALFPPNFVSGATIQADRLARGIRERGHDVHVFAGARGTPHQPGECWDDSDATGLPIRWMATTPWLATDHEYNYNNPVAEERFAEFLRLKAPGTDVVHMHPIQSLGGGMLRVAAEAGARVVITMHDLWWHCAQLFMVDQNMRPCCPVADAGICPCHVDVNWARARRNWLRPCLGYADVILTPSSISARAHAANGVDPAKLRVDENGLPPLPQVSSVSRRAAGGPLRFLFIGPNREKGVHVMLEAARLLAGTPGWELDAYGAGDYVAASGIDLTGLPVRILPAYSALQVPEVFGSCDLLVIASIVRESYSIVAREALQNGLPIITSDCYGPEEVVTHGRNGYVLPTGDAEALADAMRNLIRHPEIVVQMREMRGDIAIRTLDDQISGLINLYGELLDERR